MINLALIMAVQNPITFLESCSQVNQLRCLGLGEREIEIIYDKYGYKSLEHVQNYIRFGLNFTQIMHILEYTKQIIGR